MSKIIYLAADPMCSWCWGFAPEVHKLRAAAAGRAEVRVIVGGLRPGTVEVMDDAMKGYIRHHWEEVAAKTGQPFTYGLFDRDDFIYDTEPGCRAVVTARGLRPGADLDMLDALHAAFYAENRDLTDTDVLADVAEGIGLDRQGFLDALTSPALFEQTQKDFHLAREMGVTGFPTVVCAEDGQFAFLTLGYRPYDAFAPLLDEWLGADADGGADKETAPTEEEGAVCIPGDRSC